MSAAAGDHRLDTSAAKKLLVDEVRAISLVDELSATASHRLVASWLLHTKLHCAVNRKSKAINATNVTAVLDTVTLLDVTHDDLLSAGTLAPLRPNDVIHLTTALRLEVDAMVTNDVELARASEAAGLRVVAPRPQVG